MTQSFKRISFIVTIVALFFIALAPPAEAASVTWTKAFTGLWFPTIHRGYQFGLNNPTVQINYYAEILDEGTGVVLPPNSKVTVGAKLLLQFFPHKSEHIYWFGSGGPFNSPFGEWRVNAAPPPRITCEQKDFIMTDAIGVSAYVPLVAHPPMHTMSGLEGLQCGALSDSGEGGAQTHCTAERVGAVNPVFNLGNTHGSFY